MEMGKGRGKKAQQRKVDEFVESMEAPISPKVAEEIEDESSIPPPEEDPLADLVRCIAKAADKRKAENIRAIRISKLTAMTSFIVVVSGTSRPQNQAISASILQDVQDEFGGDYSIVSSRGTPEGTADSGWILLDYGNVMVHVMTPTSRLYYNVEGQWLNNKKQTENGEIMDLSDVIISNSAAQDTDVTSAYQDLDVDVERFNVQEEDDAFWS